MAKLAESKGWERLLLWLLTPCISDLENPTEAESATSETYDVVMKTIGCILWHCIIREQSEGKTRQVGVVCGRVLTLTPPCIGVWSVHGSIRPLCDGTKTDSASYLDQTKVGGHLWVVQMSCCVVGWFRCLVLLGGSAVLLG